MLTLRLTDNEWSCHDDKSTDFLRLQSMLDIKQLIADPDETLCAKPKSNKWHQNISANAKFVNVTLVFFLEFYQVCVCVCCPVMLA